MKFNNFEEFWPFYMNEHSKPATRWVHFVGTMSFNILAVLAIFLDWRIIFLGLLLGYGLAWCSHFFIEMNRPASFKHPIWSAIADEKMVLLMLTRKMDRELRRLQKRPAYNFD
ncbi:hypothetical protein MPTK1_2g22580 [Marchantia polymorpha subsp. ruderalis]|uniref:DUF962 domain-containing protein n=1 Tax=Marchantia polymorpha TaxID=3197 RepID=A0A2R6WNA8_MARPO|nr:hypothetical protein MARPO_0072s0073 [Marchantia polymorpha]BBN03321.1 hypothetical protein Mp_2g22580 [Marchantia polymorpha subsp. ruderalis]|eukprot:PTQ35330.1 hypothetical protein MARPO_0072s0073 [Marchantia polymorpha]